MPMRHRRNRAVGPICAWLAVVLAVAMLPVPARAQMPPSPAAAQHPPGTGAAHPVATGAKRPHESQPVIRSLFFTPDDMQQIRAAINVYVHYASLHSANSNSEVEAFLNGLVGARKTLHEPQNRQYLYYPQFFLQALVYHSPDDWMVRINHQDFSPTVLGGANLRVKKVDVDKVMVEWRPDQMDLVDRSWDKSASKDVTVDDGNGTVTFSLRPNQTFSSYVMRALEGKVLPVAVGGANAGPLDLKEKPEPAVPPTPDAGAKPATPDTSNEGFGGLINAYQQGAKINGIK